SRSSVRAASAAPVTAPAVAPAFLARSAACPNSVRSEETASVSSRRSAAISLRRSDSVAIVSVAVAQRLGREPCLLDRLLGNRLRALPQQRRADSAEDRGEQEQAPEHDEQRQPDRQGGREPGGRGRETEGHRGE